MKHVVMYSGGLGSFACARRVIEKRGKENVTLLFTDTLMEDGDLYRFLDDTSEWFGVPVTRIAEGRNPWQVFNDVRYIGNTRTDPCSRVLKREVADKWLKQNCDPAETIVYLGIDWSEKHRFDDGQGHGARLRYERNGWTAQAPMIEPEYLSKRFIIAVLKQAGIRLPRLYEMGFAHNNCGGGCIKAGQGHFCLLLEKLPQRFGEWEREEQSLIVKLGGDVAILRDRRGGTTRPLPLKELRERVEASKPVEQDEIGGCGCFLEDETAPEFTP